MQRYLHLQLFLQVKWVYWIFKENKNYLFGILDQTKIQTGTVVNGICNTQPKSSRLN